VADYYFDTSGLVKRHVSETGSGWVRSLTQPKAGHTLYIARITAVEMVAAVTRRQRGGSLSAAQAGAIIGHFRRHLTQRYRVVEMTTALFDDAMSMARKHQLRAYDAVQLAAALEVQRLQQIAGLGPVTLISADQDLNSAATAEGLLVDDPNAHP
jgi:predicted nucleic acid-binding protein